MQFYEKIEKSLETNNLDTFSRLFYEADQEQKKHIDEYSWDLALLFLNYLQKSNESQDYSLNEFILKANSHLCKYHGSPKELYLVYTQNSDYFLRQDNNFIYLVDLLQTLLERTSFKFISKSIDTSISIFNKKIKNSNLTIYTRIIQFVDSLSQIILENDSNSPSLRLLSEFLIGFFSDVSLNEVFTLITRFNKDLFKFIFCLEDKFEDKIALGNFLHFFLCGNNLTYLNSPLVFDNFFLLQKFLPLTQSLLIDSNNKPALRNGLEILEYLLKKIELYSLTDEMLEIEDILESIDILIKISVYCKYEAIRKQAGMILKNYFEKFNRKSRFEFIKYFLNKNVKFNDAINNFVVSWLIFLFKQELFECFNQEDTFYSESTGNFRYLFEKMVFLRNGFKTDLAGEATQIIACLNLIRFVLIRDKLNQTGVYTILNKNSDFLKASILILRIFYFLLYQTISWIISYYIY